MSAYYTAFGRAEALDAIPTDWNSISQAVKIFYENCSIGSHVDHIRPLAKGGIHHINNLQYLSQADNLTKGAIWEPTLIQSLINWWMVLPLSSQLTYVGLLIAFIIICILIYKYRKPIGNQLTAFGNSVKGWFVNTTPGISIKELTTPQLMTVAVFGGV